MPLKITSNGNARLLLSWHELTDKERGEFDYLDTEERRDGAEFFRYRGECYDLGELEVTEEFGGAHRAGLASIPGWDAHMADTYFSGIVVRYPREDTWIDTDRIIVGRYFCQSDY